MTVVDRKINTLYDRNGDEYEVSACVLLSLSRSLAFGVCAKKIEHNLFKSVCTLHLYMPFISGTITSSQRMSRCDIGNTHTHIQCLCANTYTRSHV